MKPLLQLLKQSPEARRLYLFSLLFFGGMWLSKTIHPLWFQQHGALKNFGLSYSAMAVMGYLAFYWGYVADKYGSSQIMRWGARLYAVGIFLRLFPESKSLAIFSGVLAGAGASAASVALSTWIIQVMQDRREQGVLLRKSSNTFGIAFGLLLAALLPVFFLQETNAYQALLLLAVILVVASSFICCAGKHVSKNKSTSWLKFFSSSPALLTALVVNGFLGGMTGSFVIPYLPIILKEKGLSLFLIGNLTAITTIVVALLEPSLSRFVKGGKRGLTSYVLIQACFIFATISLYLPTLAFVVLGVLIFRALVASVSAMSNQVLWLDRFKPGFAGWCFGVLQTCGFVGDSMGGMLAPICFEKGGVKGLLYSNAALMGINCVLFTLFYFWHMSVKSKDQSMLLEPT